MVPLRAINARCFTGRLLTFPVASIRRLGLVRLSQPRASTPYSDQKLPPESRPAPGQGSPSTTPSISGALASVPSSENNLLAPIHVPDDPNAVLTESHPAASILANSGLVVERQIEMMNLFLGFEQANRYVILDPHGNHVGYMAEHDGGFGRVMGRQWLRTHRAFTAHVFNKEQKEVLRFHRPFSIINSQIRVYDPLVPASSFSSGPTSLVNTSQAMIPGATDQSAQISPLPLPDMRIIGEAQSQWAPLKRKYNLYLFHKPPGEANTAASTESLDLSTAQQAQVAAQSNGTDIGQYTQFAYIDEPPLSWDFSLLSASNKLIGSVNRNFAGFGREIFTDTGMYALRMDAAGLEEEASKRHVISQTAQQAREYKRVVGGQNHETGMTLDQRAVMLATAVTVDYDYFSRHSHSGGMGLVPLWMGGSAEGGAAAGGAVGAAEAGEAGAVVVGGGAGRAVGGAAGASEGAMAGAGTLAGYEAMQRGMGRGEYGEQQSQQPVDDTLPPAPQDQPSSHQEGDLWDGGQNSDSGTGEDVWGQEGGDPWRDQSGGDSGDGGGSKWSVWDIFDDDDD